jgi:aminoglycoside 3-N-acetyltransferase
MAVTQTDIRTAVRELGLGNKALFVHSSLRSFGWVDGGADAVLDALLAEGCTVAAPTMCYDFRVGPPPHLRPPRNAYDYDAWDREHPDGASPGDALVYTPASNRISKEMGPSPRRCCSVPDVSVATTPRILSLLLARWRVFS